MRSLSGLVIIGVVLGIAAAPAHAISLRELVQHALASNPGIGAARAERRATELELDQAKGRLFPTVELEADVRQQRTDSAVEIGTDGNNVWLRGKQVAVTARQILFEGYDRLYDIYKNAARLDAAALRVLDTSQSTALEAVESVIDLRRHMEVVGLAVRNVRRHQEILNLVSTQFEGGKVPLSDVNQIRSRVSAADAVVAVMRRELLNTQAKFRRIVGLEPRGIEPVGWPALVPGSESEAVTIASSNNPSIRAAVANVDAAQHARDQSASAFFPEISLEGLARDAHNINGNPGFDEELLGKLVLRWTVFDGLIRHNRYRELTERVNVARLQSDVRRREIVEATEKAWAALTTGGDRVNALASQVRAAEKVVDSFLEEYELARRTLLEVLDAESLLFNARVQLVGARSIKLFAAYQLLASTGRLLESLQTEPPVETVANAQAREQRRIHVFDVFLDPLGAE